MAKRIFQEVNWTATATADATSHTSSLYPCIRGGSSTQRTDILEVMISGFAGSSAPVIMQLARSSALGSTTSSLKAPNSDAPADPATAALAAPTIPYVEATTGPQRSNAITDARLNLGLNAFGGIVRWNAAPTQQFTTL